jgi:hypothetical protein
MKIAGTAVEMYPKAKPRVTLAPAPEKQDLASSLTGE